MLFTPLTLRCGLVLKNRVALAPLTNKQSRQNGILGIDEAEFLVRRATGGFGLIETCATYIAEDGKAWEGELGIDRDECVSQLQWLNRRLHQAGAASMVQLFHGGVRADRGVSGSQPWSASTWHEDKPDFVDPRPAKLDDVQRVIRQFIEAAVRAEQAGFDGVELHGAHGYLICQFLSRTMNPEGGVPGYSGDHVGRARLAREIVRGVRAAVSPRFAVGIRLSFEDFGNAKGMDLDENLQVAAWLAEDGVDFIHASLWDISKNSAKYPDKHVLHLLRAQLPPEVAIFAAGKMWTREDAEKALALGADLVALGRAGIVNPDWPKQIAAGEAIQEPPVTEQWLLDRAVSRPFVTYLRNWKNFILTALVLGLLVSGLVACGGKSKPECYDCGGPMISPHEQEVQRHHTQMCDNAKALQALECRPFDANLDLLESCEIVPMSYVLGVEQCLDLTDCLSYTKCVTDAVATPHPFAGTTTTCDDKRLLALPVGVDQAELEASVGHDDKTFADRVSTLAAPIEVCGLAGQLDYLMRVTCADGSHPFTTRAEAVEYRTADVPHVGGRCGRRVVEYAVKCPEKQYNMQFDGYRCLRADLR